MENNESVGTKSEPEKLKDAMTPSGSQSSFNKERLVEILQRIDFPEKFGFEQKEWTVRGNFMWANGAPDTKVIFYPDEKGKFYVSQLLKDGEDNHVIHIGGIKYPGNLHKFRGGCDPWEHENVVDKARASEGGGIIYRLYDENEDGAKTHEGQPIDFGWEWKSQQPVCDYLARGGHPDIFFEDILMMHVYYGTQMLFENNKRSIRNHFNKRGYSEFIMPRPEVTMDPNSRSLLTQQYGAPATIDTIEQYFMAIAGWIMTYGNACKHRRIILDLLEMNKGNRTRHYLGVALGLALIAKEKKYAAMPEHESANSAPEGID